MAAVVGGGGGGGRRRAVSGSCCIQQVIVWTPPVPETAAPALTGPWLEQQEAAHPAGRAAGFEVSANECEILPRLVQACPTPQRSHSRVHFVHLVAGRLRPS